MHTYEEMTVLYYCRQWWMVDGVVGAMAARVCLADSKAREDAENERSGRLGKERIQGERDGHQEGKVHLETASSSSIVLRTMEQR